ncbi:NUDIX hydrolase [Streptomyces sp. NPDC014748]|uniref:NUDIX hydrolase n=1 Tax=Streptomyces sp. NPDC014748 TaxID=3364905 RepID=UPI0036FD2C35
MGELDAEVVDRRTRTVRQCATLCDTCIYRPGNLAHLPPGRVQEITRAAIETEEHVVCHSTIGTPAPAICAGFARHPVGAVRSLLLRLVGAGLATLQLVTPPRKETPMKVCDNTSVGVVITTDAGDFLMFDRATFPPGVAPAAGHIDDHGTAEDAARAEVEEELGLTVTALTHVTGWWRNNRCRRLPGPRGTGHEWTVYQASVTGTLSPSTRETRNVRWLGRQELQDLADRTVAYAAGRLTDPEFTAMPGIEPVWVQWFANLGVLDITPDDLRQIDQKAQA